jgi:hypothetical protein
MDPFRKLGLIVLMDSVDISVGGFILRYVSLVPLLLTILTYIAVVILLFDFANILRQRLWAAKLGVLLSIIAMLISTNPAHITGLSEFGSTIPLSAADITMVIGFYLLPIIYILIFYFFRNDIKSSKDEVRHIG